MKLFSNLIVFTARVNLCCYFFRNCQAHNGESVKEYHAFIKCFYKSFKLYQELRIKIAKLFFHKRTKEMLYSAYNSFGT